MCSVWRLSMLLGHSRPKVFKMSPHKAAHIISHLVSLWRTNMQQWQPAWTRISGQRFWFWSIWFAFHGWIVGRVPCGIRYDHDLYRQVHSYLMCPHRKFDRKYELEAACAEYGDDDPPWPPGPRVLAHLPDQHAITLPKTNHIFICTYICVFMCLFCMFSYFYYVRELSSVFLLWGTPTVLWIWPWTKTVLDLHSMSHLRIHTRGPAPCAACPQRTPSIISGHMIYHIWENMILFALGGDMSKHVINVWLMCTWWMCD